MHIALGWNIRSFITLVKWSCHIGPLELLQFAKTGECGYACAWTEPYGFVPEADCPIHDVPKTTFWNLPYWVHYKTLCELECHLVQTGNQLRWVKQYDTKEGDIAIVI